MWRPKGITLRRVAATVCLATAAAALVITSAYAILARLIRIPLGRGTATITWTGTTGSRPTIRSITGTAGGYAVAASGHVPTPGPISGTASSLPSQFPIADVVGTIGGTSFTLDVVLNFPSSLSSNEPQTVGHVTGTFRGQPVTATLTANVNSSSFRFDGAIGTLHVSGVVSQPIHHGHSETAHASFDVTK
jgi:hypothetical protein